MEEVRDPLAVYRASNRRRLLALAAALTVAIAVADWGTVPFVSLGFLYLFPLMIAGGVLARWQILVASAGLAGLSEAFANLPAADVWIRLGMAFVGFAGTGLFASELVRNRRTVAMHLDEVEAQHRRRRDAEDQLRALIDTSPAAILTVDAAGAVVLANEAAQRLLAPDGPALVGLPIVDFLPALDAAVKRPPTRSFRTTVQCTGRRHDGEVFFAGVWFSSYATESGPRVAAIVVDLSDEVRDREDLSLDHLLRHSRIVVSALAHEVRNLSGAAVVAHTNLARKKDLSTNEDFRALGTVIRGLGQIAGLELAPAAGGAAARVDLRSALEELRVLTETALADAAIEARWQLPAELPLVWADRYGLIQVFLNLLRNSQRAMASSPVRRIVVRAEVDGAGVVVSVEDTGPGVQSPESLFRPFHGVTSSTGLGLYVSRAILRGFGGDLVHVPRPSGARFDVALRLAAPSRREGKELVDEVRA